MTNPSLAARLLAGWRAGGPRWLIDAAVHRIVPPRLAMKDQVLSAVTGRRGLEIGGPSRVFEAGRLLPIYPVAGHIDNVNFSTRTTWEEELRDGGEFKFHPGRTPGVQRIREATTLTGIADDAYDFLLSSHCLEHVANPLQALREWRRVLKPQGRLVLLLPDPQRSFDHQRAVTTLAHLREDCARGTPEDDLFHVDEVLARHDLRRDPWAGSRENFVQRLRQNAENRCMHHHVFDLALIEAMLAETQWRVIATQRVRPVHLVAFAERM